MSDSPLKGLHRWVTNMSTVAVFVGVVIAFFYSWIAINFPEGTRLAFALILVVVMVGNNFLGDRSEQRRLSTLKRLGDGELPANEANLLAAAHEAMRLPEVSFWLCFLFLVLGALTTAGVWSLVYRLPEGVAARVAFIGVVVAPLTASMAMLVSIPRARVVLEKLVAAGLPVTRLHAAVPSRFSLPRRLMTFAAVSLFTPLALVAEFALSRLRSLLDMLVTAGDAADMQLLLDEQRAARLLPAIGLVLLVILVVTATSWLAGSMVGAPLKALAAETKRLASGAYSEPRLVAAEYETWAAAGAIAGMEAQLVALLGQLGHAAGAIGHATSSLADSSDDGERLMLQRANLDATSATTQELARSAREIAANAHRVSELAAATLAAARSGRDSAEGFLTSMTQVREGNQAIADSVVRLNKRVQQVGRIIEFINGIADKSDLLALNAELEGNKAGEVGRGFSLVAAEMRRLAESVMKSTQDIGTLIDEIRDATNAAVMATEAGVKATDSGAALAHRVGAGLSRIVDDANQSSTAMQNISLATSQQQIGTDQLVEAMADILRSTEASSVASREMRDAHDQLVSLARELETNVHAFEVKS